MINIFISTINWINDYQGLATWFYTILTFFIFILAYKELVLKKRPFIDIEMQVSKNPDKLIGGWLFFANLKNCGTCPGIIKVVKTVMTIGDETYPDNVKNEFILSPGDQKKSALIGTINNIGINRIKKREYKSNIVKLFIKIESKGLGDKKMKFHSEFVYLVDVNNKEPILSLISEKMN